MSIIYNSSKTADTINRAIDNNQGTTTTAQGATSAGLIITEDLQPVVECTGGYTNPLTVKTISGAPPVEFHAVEGNLKSWSIYGNTVEGASVGEKTDNDFEYETYFNSTFTIYGSFFEYAEIVLSPNTEYTASTSYEKNGSEVSWMIVNSTTTPSSATYGVSSTTPVTITTNNDGIARLYKRIQSNTGTKIPKISDFQNGDEWLMINTGDTAKPYAPYGYNVPVICAGITYNCYISDVLRKSTPVERKRKSKKAVNDTPVYDIMDNTGTVTRNVDTDGTPLETPVTETYTAPTIQTIWGYNTFDVDTTVTPSNVIVQYYDN